MILYNNLGVLMAMIACIPGIIFDSMMLAGILAIVADLFYRVFIHKAQYILAISLIAPRSGGHFFFLPIWIWGLILLTGLFER